MLWVAVESATLVASVAVGRDQQILAELTAHSQLTHSERLLPMLDQALDLAGVGFDQVSGLVVSAGPGSFTGLRIGLATMQGLAHARSLPVFLVSTLEALAWQQQTVGDLVVPLLDARKGQVYAAAYRREPSGLLTVRPPVAIALTELLPQLALEQPVRFVGEAAWIYRQSILAQRPDAIFADSLHNWPRAGSLASLALHDRRPPVALQLLHPQYLRLSSAEQLAQRPSQTDRSEQ